MRIVNKAVATSCICLAQRAHAHMYGVHPPRHTYIILGECLEFLASGSDPTISIRYIRVCSTGEWLVPLYLICTRHIQTC